jgi:hypothetical protein
MKYRGCSVIVWAASWYSVGPNMTLRCQITEIEYVERLGNQLYTLIQTLFPNNGADLQDDSAPIHAARTVQSLFAEHEGEQSLYLNTVEPL